MAKLVDLQQRCDKKKYIESLSENKDMAGSMPWCIFCPYELAGGCDVEHLERVRLSLCGKAYNKMSKNRN